ncbi:hypothetical protein HSX37_08125|uniref:Uncharacterized protein n=1 Tax=Dendrosporobacter quercicolus TaxID=146817 RepID=A0A1G9UVW5_9FIRM|nr:hypothetical protein [Dendrosporobacter quercicolus]NSL48009.1 hypothetical protein [Dendrosporobacter quercicolus DSM 1736]SDM64053.1 hypothetical protein SAMN04488502_10684 [Dendrosporobacter quercicolus]
MITSAERMKNRIKLVDYSMVFISVLWLTTVDFDHMTTLNWVAGGSIIGYIILFVIRRLMNR